MPYVRIRWIIDHLRKHWKSRHAKLKEGIGSKWKNKQTKRLCRIEERGKDGNM